MSDASAVWLVRYNDSYGMADSIVQPVASKADGIALLLQSMSDYDWQMQYNTLERQKDLPEGIVADLAQNDPLQVLAMMYGIFRDDENSFILEDGRGEVVLLDLWRAGDALPAR